MSSSGLPLSIEKLVAATNAHDLDRMVACFTPDYVLTMPLHPSRSFVGSEQVRRNWAAIFDGIPDITTVVTDHAVHGDDVWTEWQMSGTRRDGVPHLMRGVAIFTVVADLIRSCRFYLEPVDGENIGIDASIEQTLGATSPPAAGATEEGRQP